MARPESVAAIIVSANSAHWLRPCLTTLVEHAGDVRLDVVVVAAGCTDNTVDLVTNEFPGVRVLECENRGFAYANNRGLEVVDADWALLLNPDTEFVEGRVSDLVDELRARPEVGLVSVRQITAHGQVFPTIRRFPSAARSFFEALASERYPFRASWLGERELDLDLYERDVSCDWVTGAFMLVRRDTLRGAGVMDERFFLYCEETDLCFRIKQAGWEIRHLPIATIVHHAGKAGWSVRLDAQAAYARRQYLAKHFSPPRRIGAIAAIGLGYALRSALTTGDRRASARASLSTLFGFRGAPFMDPPSSAISPRGD